MVEMLDWLMAVTKECLMAEMLVVLMAEMMGLLMDAQMVEMLVLLTVVL